jgi:hypothetical protein
MVQAVFLIFVCLDVGLAYDNKFYDKRSAIILYSSNVESFLHLVRLSLCVLSPIFSVDLISF